MANSIGRLEKVNLRDAWPDEARDFTPWLSQPENIVLLAETLQLELEVKGIEVNVGPFRADILCQDVTEENSLVLIENQYGKTDHDHFGKLLTYAAGLDVRTLVWIAEQFQDEHRAALDWLNRQSVDGIDFFGIQLELWRIGNSAPAPRFNIVSRPNHWTERIRESTRIADLGPGNLLYLDYWKQFRAKLEADKFYIRPTKALPQTAMMMRFSTGIPIYAAIAARTGLNRISLWFLDQYRTWFDRLRNDGDEIIKEFGLPLEFFQAGKSDYIRCDVRDQPISDRTDWPRQHAWMCDIMERMGRVFLPRLKLLAQEGGVSDTGGIGSQSFEEVESIPETV